jgi:MGT family glycosyltransferase
MVTQLKGNMKIVIPTIGSRGDLQPFIALAQGLVRDGHSVTLASHPLMEPLVQSHCVSFQSIGPDINLPKEVADIRQSSKSSAAGLVRAMRFSFDMLERSHSDILALCSGADLVVVSAQSAAGKNEADQLGVPYLSVSLMPWAIPWSDPQRPIVKRIVYSLIDGLVSLITTRPLNRIRKNQGLPPVGREGFTSRRLNLIPVSPAVYAPNPLWEARHKIVGYWFSEDPDGWRPPPELVAFLENGPPPVLISLGAMSLGDVNAKEVVQLFVEASQRADVRGIIQGWESGVSQVDLPATVFPAGSIPHLWLLPQCGAIVHHGGFGTTSAGLRAGIPAIIIPHIADQFYWANIIKELGVGLKPIPRKRLSAAMLATSLNELMNNGNLRQTASSLAEKISAENGIENAVMEIEREFA